jgi:hypothetical protein
MLTKYVHEMAVYHLRRNSQGPEKVRNIAHIESISMEFRVKENVSLTALQTFGGGGGRGHYNNQMLRHKIRKSCPNCGQQASGISESLENGIWHSTLELYGQEADTTSTIHHAIIPEVVNKRRNKQHLLWVTRRGPSKCLLKPVETTCNMTSIQGGGVGKISEDKT